MSPDEDIEFATKSFARGVSRAPLELRFTPIQSLSQTGPFYRVEATLKRNSEEGIPVYAVRTGARRNKCEGELERWLLDQCFELAGRTQAAPVSSRFLVTVEARRPHPEFLDGLKAMASNQPSSGVVVGLTFRSSDADHDECKSIAVAARAAGFELSIEDAQWDESGWELIERWSPNYFEIPATEWLGADPATTNKLLTRLRASGIQLMASQLEKSSELAPLFEMGIRFFSGPLIGAASPVMDFDFS